MYKKLDSDALEIFANHGKWLKLVQTKKGRLSEEEMELRGDLSGFDLSGCALRQVDMSYMNLQDTDFSNSQLMGVKLKGVDAREANFSYAKLLQCDLKNGCFFHANFDHAQIDKSDLSHAFFVNANAKAARMININARGSFLMEIDAEGLMVDGGTFDYAHVNGINEFINTPFLSVH